MSPAIRASLYAFLVFTVYFIAGSLISDSMQFPYGYVSVGGLILFFLSGFLVARHYRVITAALATGVAALLASLTGWLVIALVNPGQAPNPRPQTEAIGEVVLLMTLAGLIMGGCGAWVAGLVATGKAEA
jgi:hypothetical protein